MLYLSKFPPAAFRRLCVETIELDLMDEYGIQPPSGGCVLKPVHAEGIADIGTPAAFRRLCVETLFAITVPPLPDNQPPSGGCVLKQTIAIAGRRSA